MSKQKKKFTQNSLFKYYLNVKYLNFKIIFKYNRIF